MRSSTNPNTRWPRLVSLGAFALLILGVYQCGSSDPASTAGPGEPGAAAPDAGLSAGLVLSAEAVEVGDELAVEVFVEVPSAVSLGAYQARLNWDASVFSLAEVSDGSTAAFAQPPHRAEEGALAFSQFNAQGANGRVSLLRARFSVVGGSGARSLGLTFSALTAANTFADLLPSLEVASAQVEVGEG